MNNLTLQVLKDVHPGWMKLLGTRTTADKLLVDILDETLTEILALNVLLCPDDPGKVLRCLQLDPEKIKVVIVNNYMYHTPGAATGLAFASDSLLPPLTVLVDELVSLNKDDSLYKSFDPTLKHWEDQGVLLLNTNLSCEQFKQGSHCQYWTQFITELLIILSNLKLTRSSMDSLVFVFIGTQAQMYSDAVNEKLNYKISRYHPTNESFPANKFVEFFTEVNTLLKESNQTEIKWT